MIVLIILVLGFTLSVDDLSTSYFNDLNSSIIAPEYDSGDICNYGAVGDGITDDTEDIRRAVTG